MGMERLGLVSQLEGELERIISLGLLPKDGELPSEQSLAKRYGVSRTTAREALMRLSARGLVVQHPGRRARAVALDEALTLENLGMVLHGEASRHPERKLLLEGYLALKREVTVELLSACCEQASEAELDTLQQACFSLEDASGWEQQRSRWVPLEFDLLRHAAAAAQRPGHLLLIQSLERAFRAMARRVVPCLDSQAMASWARCAREALADKEVLQLRTRLSALLKARDERVLAALVPTREAGRRPETLGHGPRAPEPEPSSRVLSTEMQAPEVKPPGQAPGIAEHALEVRQPDEAPGTAMQTPDVGTPAPEQVGAEVPGARWANLSGCRTGSCEAPPPEPLSVPASFAPGHAPSGAVLNAGPATGHLEAPETYAPTPSGDEEPRPVLPACPRPGAAHQPLVAQEAARSRGTAPATGSRSVRTAASAEARKDSA